MCMAMAMILVVAIVMVVLMATVIAMAVVFLTKMYPRKSCVRNDPSVTACMQRRRS